MERDRQYREEKQRKREEEEEAQEARIPAALAEYIRDNGRVPGAGYRSIVRKYRIDQQQLRDVVQQNDEEIEELLDDSNGDDPCPEKKLANTSQKLIVRNERKTNIGLKRYKITKSGFRNRMKKEEKATKIGHKNGKKNKNWSENMKRAKYWFKKRKKERKRMDKIKLLLGIFLFRNILVYKTFSYCAF